jgi:predicted ATPase/class 3 adenylate cyclase
MVTFTGYRILEKINEGREYTIYSALRESDKLPVILKTLRSEHPNTNLIALLYHEYEMSKYLTEPGVIQTYELIDQHNQYALVQEDIQGISLHAYLQKNPITQLSVFLKFAIQMTQVLDMVHKHAIIHKDIKPSNFIIHPTTLTIKITDFNYSTRLLSETQDLAPPDKLEGTLAYMAPEQTGRMNMHIDYRSDFYALGVTFYEMLTGELPFTYDDPLQLLHAHLTAPTPELNNFQFDIPPVMANIIKKLMAKNLSGRYQSVGGILADLERCQEALLKAGKIAPFPLGENDVIDRLNLSQKLYGREEEAKILLAAYERVSQGAVEALMVTGYSGIGKTTLVNEVHKPMVRDKGYFVTGKFALLQRNTPYTAITQAFNQLARLILSEPEERFQVIKHEIQEAVGQVGQVIIDLAPEFALVMGAQPALEKLGGKESQNRLMIFFKRFLAAVAKPEHPLVIFIDDLQWVDEPSLNILGYLMTDPDLTNILLLGAYRENEVNDQHRIQTFFKELREKNRILHTLTLAPLTLNNFVGFLKDSLHRDETTVMPLAELLHQRTEGNPFFAKEIITTLYKEKLLYFDNDKKQFAWKLEEIRALKITINVVDLMLAKIQSLPPSTQSLLKYASCMGSNFTVEILKVVSGKSVDTISSDLWPALEQNLITTKNMSYKRSDAMRQETLATQLAKEITYQFIHDRVQQTLYQQMNETDKKQVHLTIARLLLKNNPEIAKQERIFEVTDHFDQALDLLEDAEKEPIAELNYAASTRAKDAAAYQPMHFYLTAALSLLPKNSWRINYALAFKIHHDYALSLFLTGKLPDAEKLIDETYSHANNVLDKVSLHRLKMMIHSSRSELQKGLDEGSLALALLGIRFSPNANLKDIIINLIKIQWYLRRHKTAILDKELPLITDPKLLAGFEIFNELILPSSTKDMPSTVYIYSFGMLFELKYGKPPSAACWVTTYAFLAIVLFKNVKLTFNLLEVSNRLLEEMPDRYSSSFTYLCSGYFLCHLYYRFKVGKEYCLKGFEEGYKSGNILTASHCKTMVGLITWAEAKSLEETLNRATDSLNLYIENHMYGFIQWRENEIHLFNDLLGKKPIDLKKLVPLEQTNLGAEGTLITSMMNRIFSFYYYFIEDYDQAMHYHKLWCLYDDKIRFDPMSHEVKMLGALSFARLIPTTRGLMRWKYRRIINKVLRELAWISSLNPGNYLHIYLILKGTEAKLNGNFTEAAKNFNLAIENAKKIDVYLWCGLANELMCEMLIEQSQPRFAIDYVREAFYYYMRYGLMTKVELFKKRYGQYLVDKIETDIVGLSPKHSVTISETSSPANFDVMSIIKASQTISGEIVLEKLFKKMLHIVIENAGAERALFLEHFDHVWQVTASLNVSDGHDEKFSLLNIPLVDYPDIPQTIVQFILRSRLPVVLDLATTNTQYSHDPYIERAQPMSILCLPILHQDQVLGIIYLENNLTAGAFTQDRVNILTTLSSQIAISLQNSHYVDQMQRLYQKTERFVPKRFLEILQKKNIQEVELGDSVQIDLTAMFADIRGFTAIAETLTPKRLSLLLNTYLGYMAPIIREHRGFVEHFLGDGIMALFPRTSDDAVRAALVMQRQLTAFNAEIKNNGFKPIEMGIGLHYGPAMLSILGEAERFDANVVSDAINATSRIENLNKYYQTSLLISEKVYANLRNPNDYLISIVDKVKVKGKSRSMLIYEVNVRPTNPEELQSIEAYNKMFTQGFTAYEQGDFIAAEAIFNECLHLQPNNTRAEIFRSRCEEFKNRESKIDWDGAVTMLEK